MIRRLTILLLIVGCVFGDTIKYESIDINGNFYTTSITGEYAGIYNNKVFVRTAKGGIFEIDCEAENNKSLKLSKSASRCCRMLP